MQNRIDATIDMARTERESLRWILLSALWHGRPYGVNEHVLLMTARDVLLRSTPKPGQKPRRVQRQAPEQLPAVRQPGPKRRFQP